MPPLSQPNFWETKSLSELTPAEWEALCDGCARCCLNKLMDDQTSEVFYTDVACRFLDIGACRCRAYANRFALVPDCVHLTPDMIRSCHWLPSTCAYRLVADGRPLPTWHPLVTGRRDSPHRAGMSLRDHAISEDTVPPDELTEHIVGWVVAAGEAASEQASNQ